MDDDNYTSLGLGLSIVVLAIFYFFCMPFIGVSVKLTNNTLLPLGYSNIHTHGFSYFGCANDDWYATKFTATFNNRNIEGVVCCGLIFKNCTIRYN